MQNIKYISKWYSHGTHLQQLDYAIAHIDLIAYFFIFLFLNVVCKWPENRRRIFIQQRPKHFN